MTKRSKYFYKSAYARHEHHPAKEVEKKMFFEIKQNKRNSAHARHEHHLAKEVEKKMFFEIKQNKRM